MNPLNLLEKLLSLLPVKNIDGVLCITSGALLTIPSKTLETIGLAQHAHQNRHIIGILFLVSASCLIVRSLAAISQHLIKCASDHSARKRQKRILQSLSQHEQEILRQFATSQHGELAFNRANKAIITLVDKGILLDLRPTLNEKIAQRYYRIAPAYMEHVDTHFRHFTP